jgi:ankyrin repeat protein
MPRHRAAAGCIFFLLLSNNCPAAAPPARSSIAALIDQLADVAQVDYGYSPTVSSSEFFSPLDREGRPGAILLVPQSHSRSAALRELVRHGAAAVPDLVAHLRDRRRTRLTVGLQGFNVVGRPWSLRERASGYTLTVGDLCYVALGQIINRDHTVVSYFPSGNLFINSVDAHPERIADLTREWGRVTPARHKAALLYDASAALDETARVGACKRLAYYYPEALEPLALKLLTSPVYKEEDVKGWHGRPETAEDVKDRKRYFQEFVLLRGQATYEGIRRKLFADLRDDEACPAILRPEGDDGSEVRWPLEGLFGYRQDVRSSDRPAFFPLERGERVSLIKEALIHLLSEKVDRAVRALLASAKAGDELGPACVEALAGHGHEADIERYLRRCGDYLTEDDRARAREVLGWTPLHAAVDRGRADLVPALVAAGARPDARSRAGDTPLHLAARSGDVEILRLLLRHKADLDLKGRLGLTPVQEAVRNDHDSAALLLLKHGCKAPDILVAAVAGRADLLGTLLDSNPASLGAKTEWGRTPLFLAIRHGHVEAARRLIARGAGASSPLDDGWAPLLVAAANGHADLARLLLAHKAKVNVRLSESKITPLHLAAGGGHQEMVRVLLDAGADVNAADHTGRTALFHAAETGHEAVVDLLLKRKASLLHLTNEGDTVLHAAATEGRANVIAALLKAGMPVQTTAVGTGETALHRAASAGRLDAERQLLDSGAKIDAGDKDGNTPLHDAAHSGHEDVVRLLLARGAEVDAVNKLGATPLVFAAWFGRAELVEVLLRHRANPNRFTPDSRNISNPFMAMEWFGNTPLWAAARQGHAAVVQVLLAHKADPYFHVPKADGWTTVLHQMASSGSTEGAELLLKSGVSVDCRDSRGETPLHYAARGSGLDSALMLKLLLRYKADIRARSKADWEPIHHAAQANDVAAVKTLLDHKADVNVQEKVGGRTPLHLAIEGGAWPLDEPSEESSLPVVAFLLKHKADFTLKDRKGRTPLALAEEMKYAKVAQLLRRHGAKR